MDEHHFEGGVHMNTIQVLFLLVLAFFSFSCATTSPPSGKRLCNNFVLSEDEEGSRAEAIGDHVLLSGELSRWDRAGSLLVGVGSRASRSPWVMAVRFEEILEKESPAEYLQRVLDEGEVLECEKMKEMVYRCRPPTWSDAMSGIEVSLSVLRVRYKFRAIRGCTIDFIGSMDDCGCGDGYQVLCHGNCGVLTFIDWNSGVAQEADCYLNLPFCGDSPSSD